MRGSGVSIGGWQGGKTFCTAIAKDADGNFGAMLAFVFGSGARWCSGALARSIARGVGREK